MCAKNLCLTCCVFKEPPQLSTDHSCLVFIPHTPAHSLPCVIMTHLHTSFIRTFTVLQANTARSIAF